MRWRFAAVLLVFLAACPAKQAPKAGPSGSSVQPGVRGGTLRVLLADDVDAIDPQRAGSPPSFGLARAMHRGLMAFPAASGAEGARPVPDLADAPPAVSPDGLRYEFHLRDDIAFGAPASRPVKASDVKAGLERIFTARSPMASYFRIIAGADALAARTVRGLSGVTAPDDRTVVITLARPANDLLWLLALPAASAVPAGLPPVPRPNQISGAGPYRLADRDGYVPERGIHLVRNDAWKDGSDPIRHAYVDEITFQIGLAPAEIARRIADGRADLAGDEPPAGTAAPSLPDDRLVRAPNGCLRYLFMNRRVSPFSSVRVRRAVAAAVDRSAIAATYRAAADAAASILPPTVLGYDAARAVPKADPEAARSMLAAAGYASGFATRLVVGDESIDAPQAAAIRTALARAGVRVTIDRVPIASLYEDRYEVAASGTPMGIATWCADWPGLGGRGSLQRLLDGRSIPARGSTDYSGMNDGELNRAMDAAGSERDPAKAAAAWQAADAIGVGLAGVVPLAFLDAVSPLGPRARGFLPHSFFVRGDFTSVWLQGS